MWPFRRSSQTLPVAPDRAPGIFSTDMPSSRGPVDWSKRIFQRTMGDLHVIGADGARVPGAAMDSALGFNPTLKGQFALANGVSGIPELQLGWYASQSFIGYQMCAILAQQWLVDKACTMPAKDAVRNGFDVTVNDGTKVDPTVFDYMRARDKHYKLTTNLVQFERMNRVFGIRIAIFKIDGVDYEAPFNPDGIMPGSYKGISQVDPYWITPELDLEAAAEPAAIDFYEPTYWRVNGKRYHKSHLVIIRTCDVPDVLKPTYFYGGIPVPQRIFERVYAAERTANEAPMLALAKRLAVIQADLSAIAGNEEKFAERMNAFAFNRDNWGAYVVGLGETVEQLDTALADMDALIMTQYQLVASGAEVPATKLYGTMPKGFNATGEYEQASYHEFLESIQEHDLMPLIDRHYLIMMRSDVAPHFSMRPVNVTITFNPIDTATAAEAADIRLKNSQADQAWQGTGAIDGEDIRNRLIKDKDSGYSGIPAETMEASEPEDDEPAAAAPAPVTPPAKPAAVPAPSAPVAPRAPAA